MVWAALPYLGRGFQQQQEKLSRFNEIFRISRHFMSPNFKTFGLSCKSKTLTQVYNHKQKQLKNTKNGLKEITRTSNLWKHLWRKTTWRRYSRNLRQLEKFVRSRLQKYPLTGAEVSLFKNLFSCWLKKVDRQINEHIDS